MKVSVITVSFNSAATIKDTLDTFQQQDYPDKEHIVIDGGSTDGTVDILKSYGDKIYWISEKDTGIYNAMNKGLRRASGDIIGHMNADDFYPTKDVLSSVVNTFKTTGTEAVYGDKQYVDAIDTSKLLRHWVAGPFAKENFLHGWMPPHLSFYLKKTCYDSYGFYNESFRSSGDYEMMLRMLYKNACSASYLPKVLTKMRAGGTSNATWKSRLRANQEDRRAWVINGLKPRWYTLWWKPLSKLPQYFTKPKNHA